METNSNTNTQPNDESPKSVAAAGAASPVDTSKLRTQRINEFEALGLKNAGLFAAPMAAIQADLFRAANLTGPLLIRELANATPETPKRVQHILAQHLQVIRQIERFRHLELRGVEVKQKTELMARKLFGGQPQPGKAVEVPLGLPTKDLPQTAAC